MSIDVNDVSEIGGDRFAALWHRCVAVPPSPDSPVVHAELRRLLGAPQRRFHNLNHIRDCVRRMDEVVTLLADPNAVELALWFHDAIYNPGDPDNERRSADLFLARSAGASSVFRRRVCGLVVSTRHDRRVYGNDRRYVNDIDLAGFGAPWAEFMRQGALLRAEFCAQTDAQYRAGQIWFLEGLRRRSQFFATDYFRERFEPIAQENLQRLLDTLASENGESSATS